MADKRVRELYRGDCLDILEDYVEPNSVDLIYLDPPFNSKSTYNLPFKDRDKSYRSVEAFVDTWTWTADDDIRLAEMDKSFESDMRVLADIVKLARTIGQMSGGGAGRTSSSASYLLNMALRLRAMRHVLKDTGSIYLHCDQTEGHCLKLVMDVVFGKENFLNEIVWHYGKWTNAARHFQKNHDVLLVYTKNRGGHVFNKLFSGEESYHYEKGWHTNTVSGGISQLIVYDKAKAKEKIESGQYDNIVYREGKSAVALPDVWDIPIINPMAKERLGYPTQKPLALLDRIIKASSNPNDIVLDSFCGCGTTVHAAEQLGRQWIGIDISRFSTELMRERILHNFPQVQDSDIRTLGLPESIDDAKSLARENPFEFEKWVCGRIGANGMGIRKAPGDRGADGGIDGVIELALIHGRKVDKAYVIVQVKGGNVTPDAVKALSETVRRLDAVAGVMVCFEDQMNTVENQRSRDTWSDDTGTYPFIQGYSVDDLLQDKRLKLPSRYGRKRGGRMSALI